MQFLVRFLLPNQIPPVTYGASRWNSFTALAASSIGSMLMLVLNPPSKAYRKHANRSWNVGARGSQKPSNASVTLHVRNELDWKSFTAELLETIRATLRIESAEIAHLKVHLTRNGGAWLATLRATMARSSLRGSIDTAQRDVAMPRVSIFLQTYGNQMVGPVLVLLGMFFLGLIPASWSRPAISTKIQKRVDAFGVWAALPLGIFFALAFCPISAACFFISLFRLLASYDSRVILPVAYSLGTALPAVVFSVLIAFSAQAIGNAFNVLTGTVRWMQRAAGGACPSSESITLSSTSSICSYSNAGVAASWQ